MKQIIRHIIGIFLIGMLCGACQKEPAQPDGELAISQIKILNEPDVQNAISVVAGDGVYLLVYTNVQSEYLAMLISNTGVKLWTKNISQELGFLISEPAMTIEEVVYAIDDTFAFFSGRRMVKLDLNGFVVYDNAEFVSAIPDGNNQSRIWNVFLTQDGGYFVCGSFRPSSSVPFRAYYSKYSRTGVIEFSELYLINTGGHMGITSVLESQGGYVLGGYYTSVGSANKSAFYTLDLSNDGELLSAHVHETTSFLEGVSGDEVLGRELIRLADGNLMYYMVPSVKQTSDQRSKGYVIDGLGVLVDSVLFDFIGSNVLAGTRPSIGKGVVQSGDGHSIGLLNPNSNTEESGGLGFGPIINYETPSFGYLFHLNAFGGIEEMKFLDQSLYNRLTSVEVLSDGSTVIFGIRQSIDNEFNIMTLTYEPR